MLPVSSLVFAKESNLTNPITVWHNLSLAIKIDVESHRGKNKTITAQSIQNPEQSWIRNQLFEMEDKMWA